MIFEKGHVPWNRGLKGTVSLENRKKTSERMRAWFAAGGPERRAAVRAKMAPACTSEAANLKRVKTLRTPEVRASISKSLTGRSPSPETIVKRVKKIKEAWMRREFRSPEVPGGCEICGRPYMDKAKRSLCKDHDHSTGKLRGRLCHQCNVGIGMFRDDVQLLERAILYLVGYQHCLGTDSVTGEKIYGVGTNLVPGEKTYCIG